MKLIKRFFGHLKTVTRHRHLVLCGCIRAGIPVQGLLHDLSKFSPTEFFPGVRFYDGHHSPTEDERRLNGYSKAWMHHGFQHGAGTLSVGADAQKVHCRDDL